MISGSCLEESAALARESLSAAGVRTVSEKKLVNGLQVILSMGGRSCGMNYYWSVRKGFSAVPAGGDSNLIEFAMGALSGEAALPPVVEGFRIGTDEAGKGDWFGPLVAAGVACDDGVVRELVAMGVATMLAFYCIVNIGMTMGLMPVTGLPLPFLSYGGSSLVSSFLAVGLLLSVYMRRFMY